MLESRSVVQEDLDGTSDSRQGKAGCSDRLGFTWSVAQLQVARAPSLHKLAGTWGPSRFFSEGRYFTSNYVVPASNESAAVHSVGS